MTVETDSIVVLALELLIASKEFGMCAIGNFFELFFQIGELVLVDPKMELDSMLINDQFELIISTHCSFISIGSC